MIFAFRFSHLAIISTVLLTGASKLTLLCFALIKALLIRACRCRTPGLAVDGFVHLAFVALCCIACPTAALEVLVIILHVKAAKRNDDHDPNYGL